MRIPKQHAPTVNCPTCRSQFDSVNTKTFCSIKCFTDSPEFKNDKRYSGAVGNCVECGAEIYIKASSDKKFCDKHCYRAYKAKRFDRFVASHTEIKTLNNYDEFLTRDVMPCLVAECDWKGSHLSMHMNQHHGIKADVFKIAAGFNLTTGVVTPALSAHLRETSVASDTIGYARGKNVGSDTSKQRHPVTREAKEARLKINAIKVIDRQYAAVCHLCLTAFDASYPQHLRERKNLPIFCGLACRQTFVSHQR